MKNVKINNGYLSNEIKKKIKKIREMLLIHKISTDREIIIPDHPQFYEDEVIKNKVQNYKKYEGRNLNELSQYLKEFLSKNKNKDN